MWEWIVLPALILVVVLSIVTAKPKPGQKSQGRRGRETKPIETSRPEPADNVQRCTEGAR